ncbi:MAG: HAD-IA family hydrolase [Armatimonadota bacterium]|nr:HAD-IA family hydrolase [Armatimonadota bacterium]MDR5703191.1 HAD-IA family hydrolase [Armatimonadota bacterium]MDR7434757.1 HAD-IA family hydrolase [Armatimonadota bacterium]
MRYRAIFFDAGGTLIDLHPPREVLFTEIMRDLGFLISPEASFRAFDGAEEWFEKQSALYQQDPERFWREWYETLLVKAGLGEKATDLVPLVAQEFQRRLALRPIDDVVETLEHLRRLNLVIGVVSNWDKALPEVLEKAGVSRFLDFVIASEAVGVSKPDPRIFQIALAKAGVPPEGVLHVGDLYEYDVVGARSAGITPVLIDRADRYPHADCIRIRRLNEIVPLVDWNLRSQVRSDPSKIS